MEVYLGELETSKDGEKVSLDNLGAWCKAAMEQMQEIMDKVSPCMRSESEEEDNPLAPLRRAMGEVASLSEAVTKAEDKPDEERLRFLGHELGSDVEPGPIPGGWGP